MLDKQEQGWDTQKRESQQWGERPGKSETHGETLRERETQREGRREGRQKESETKRDRLTDGEADTERGERGKHTHTHTHRSRKGDPRRVDAMTPTVRPAVCLLIALTLCKLSLDLHSCPFPPSLEHRAVLLNLETGS